MKLIGYSTTGTAIRLATRCRFSPAGGAEAVEPAAHAVWANARSTRILGLADATVAFRTERGDKIEQCCLLTLAEASPRRMESHKVSDSCDVGAQQSAKTSRVRFAKPCQIRG